VRESGGKMRVRFVRGRGETCVRFVPRRGKGGGRGALRGQTASIPPRMTSMLSSMLRTDSCRLATCAWRGGGAGASSLAVARARRQGGACSLLLRSVCAALCSFGQLCEGDFVKPPAGPRSPRAAARPPHAPRGAPTTCARARPRPSHSPCSRERRAQRQRPPMGNNSCR